MKKIIKKIYNTKKGKYFLIPLLLFSIWVFLSCLYIIYFDTSLSVLSYYHNKNSFINNNYNKLLAGEKISGQFKAVENNLGIVSIKFQTFIRPPYLDEDTLVFKLKEKGAKNWYYQNTYRDGLIYDVPIFPFGFPQISNSKGKTYYFEISSLNGNSENSVALSSRGQILFSKYKFSKSVLLHNKKAFAIFILEKFISAILTSDIRFSSFIYLLPLIFYLLLMSPAGKIIIYPTAKKLNDISLKIANDPYFKPIANSLKILQKIVIYNLEWIIIFLVIFDIFITQVTNDVIYLVIILLWISVLKIYKMNSKITFIFALILLLIPPISFLLKDSPTAEKAAIWAYMFLIAGFIQILFEYKNGKSINY